ncbi:VWA domain-containing protein [Anaeromyxobacter oryzae]|uniref:VWA containing CoxE family protein n=1 Tax=Anaeromyxobacter oryzae TaxID=2918170 RepID=A0ABM7X1D2_9BACT|nr:VWA domain-containing protein [Anaeromyxobacter oryzae]BDG05577.1 hypothetical protein AMOR_45730 [Anaeromyxobacter oryzae]
MERIVTRFVARLRQRGVRVSPGESVDAVRALGAAPAAEGGRAHARAVLQLTLVKSLKDAEVFEAVFEEFFGDGAGAGARRAAAEVEDDATVALDGQRSLARPPNDEGERSGATLAVDDGSCDGAELDLDGLQPQDGDASGGPRLAVETRRYRGEKARTPSRVGNYTQGPIYVSLDDEFLAKWRNQGVKPFLPEEEEAMEDVVARMVRRLQKDVRQTRSRQRRGRLSVIKTLQRNHRHGMVPFVKVLRRKRKQTPRLVVLCDVSFSVSHASRFMLLLLHTLQKGLLDVRSFVFNRELAEVTPLLRSMRLNEVLELIDGGGVVDLEDNSDFGHAFVAFERNHLASLRGRPAVIVLGDARNNYNEAHESALAEIREKAGYVMWLTPEDRSSWDLGDCLMSTYAPYCDRVEVVKNVEELSAVVEELVRTCAESGAAARSVKRLPWRHGGMTVRA